MCADCHSTNLRKGYDAAQRQLPHHLVRDRRLLRGLPRPGLRHVRWAEQKEKGETLDVPDMGLTVRLDERVGSRLDRSTPPPGSRSRSDAPQDDQGDPGLRALPQPSQPD